MLRVLVLAVLAVGCECRDGTVEDPALRQRLAAALAAKGPAYKPHTRHLRPDGSPRYTNRLILEASPYLAQHAHNPVDWYPWGDEAFAKAEREGKLVLLSIGYSTCHWCHVMADESFEDEAIARELAKHYVAIKVDREERPDLDAIYLQAVQRMTGSGGWPLTVILLPDRRPVFGGTYFPPHDGTRGAGLATVLDRVRREPRDGLERRATALVAELRRTAPAGGRLPDRGVVDAARAAYARAFDAEWGGFGRPPKFPRPAVLQLLLRAGGLEMVTQTLDKLAAGGIHDQLGGGFHRYAVDDKWRVPHFEKMLYDNAQLAVVYLEAYQATGRAEYATVARSTLDFMLRELAEGQGFASAIDADSEGREGTYYVWRTDEVDRIVGDAASPLIRRYFDLTIGGNFEHGTNILWRPAPVDIDPALLADARAKLLAARSTRVRPHVDRKILVAWNALAISALARAALILDEPRYLAAARAAASLVLARSGGRIGHSIILAARAPSAPPLTPTIPPRSPRGSITGGTASGAPFLDDHAFLIAALIDLLAADPDPRWLREAIALQRDLDDQFADPAGGYFFTARDHEQLLVRDKPDHDDAIPSGNSVAALNLLRLYELTGDARYRATAEAILRAFSPSLASMPALVAALAFYLDQPRQIVLVAPRGGTADALLAKLRTTFVPHHVLLRVTDGDAPITPLVEDKIAQGGKPTAYVCLGTTCKQPTSDPDVFASQLR